MNIFECASVAALRFGLPYIHRHQPSPWTPRCFSSAFARIGNIVECCHGNGKFCLRRVLSSYVFFGRTRREASILLKQIKLGSIVLFKHGFATGSNRPAAAFIHPRTVATKAHRFQESSACHKGFLGVSAASFPDRQARRSCLMRQVTLGLKP